MRIHKKILKHVLKAHVVFANQHSVMNVTLYPALMRQSHAQARLHHSITFPKSANGGCFPLQENIPALACGNIRSAASCYRSAHLLPVRLTKSIASTCNFPLTWAEGLPSQCSHHIRYATTAGILLPSIRL